MNWNLRQLSCDFCKTNFNCSVGLSNKNTAQTFSFCCPSCSGILSIEIDPCRKSNYTLINISYNEKFNGSVLNLKTIKLHLDFPTIITDGFNIFSPYILACLSLKDNSNIEHFKMVTDDLNFYSENILKLKSFFAFYKNKRLKELLGLSKFLLRDEFESIIKLDDDYINSISIFDYITTREIDIIFYKTLFGISRALNKGNNPDDEIKDISLYLSNLSKEKSCEFRSYLSKNEHLRNAINTSNKIYENIYSNEEFFRPAIFLFDYSVMGYKDRKSPLRLVSEKIDVILGVYKDIVETISKQYTLIVGLRNLKDNGDYDRFSKSTINLGKKRITINNIVDFSNLDFGLKSRFMEGCCYYNDAKKISHKIRNAIAHNNWEYNELTQDVTFYYDKGIVDELENVKSERKTILEINRDIVILFRLMHKLNIFYYLFNCYWGVEDWNEQ